MEASSREFTDTEIIMDTQTEVKLLIKNALINARYMVEFREQLEKVIDEGLAEVKNEELKARARRSLIEFGLNEYNELVKKLEYDDWVLLIALLGNKKIINNKAVQKAINSKIDINKLNSAFTNLGDSNAKVGRMQSLRSFSELTARHEKQKEMIETLSQKTRLVICDTHSDCSDRCFKWQGRVYSLDGTSGVTEDGREYVPLETATNVIDKYGHRNGLLGYNCRHKLVEFKVGLRPVRVTKEEQKRESEITATQRLYEQEIRKQKERALLYGRGTNVYKQARENIRELTSKYEEFCINNGRTIYRSRIKV